MAWLLAFSYDGKKERSVYKHELTAQQLADRLMIITTLSQAGWNNPFDEDEFDKGGYCDPEAGLDYANQQVNLEVDYNAKPNMLALSINGDLGEAIDLNIFFGDQLKLLLEALILVQDDLSPENFREPLRKFVEICPDQVYIAYQGTFVKLANDQ